MSTVLPTTALPALPLLLWDSNPGLEVALSQEGVAFRVVREPNPLSLRAGRFVLFDGRRVSRDDVRSRLTAEHVAIDVDQLRHGLDVDPFLALTDTTARRYTWRIEGVEVSERVARHPKAAVRRAVIERLRRAVEQAGGVWARLAAFPHPYRSAFNLRLDLDEPAPWDYFEFARARRPLDDCSTHFVSTHAYGDCPEVLDDLLRLDAQSHGHYHVVYRDEDANRRNLLRAHRTLEEAGHAPVGFAAPHGRWNRALDRALEGLGFLYSSDFSVAYDDLPAFPWLGDRFSTVLQVPVHPICEGLFDDAGVCDGRAVARHLANVVDSRVDAGEPAFVYGHPERRLARLPEVVGALARAIEGRPLVWRVTLTDFARWWHWRAGRSWALVPRGDGRFEVQFEDGDARHPLTLEILRGRHVAAVPVRGPRFGLRMDDLAYELRTPASDVLPPPTPAPRRSWRERVREALDWETVTPVEELPNATLPDRLKKGLRRWRSGAGATAGGGAR